MADPTIEAVLDALRQAAAGQTSEHFVEPVEDLPPVSLETIRPEQAHRPSPVSDPRILHAPGGTIKYNDSFYISRPSDERILQEAPSETGVTVVVKAPRQMGKSSLLIRYLAACHEAGKRFAYLDFQLFSDTQLDHYSTLLTEIVAFLCRSLNIANPNPVIASHVHLTNFIEDQILKTVSEPLVLAFDEVDRILGRPYQSDFFGMLRLWHNQRAVPFSPWERVGLALSISTEPYLLIDAADRSPFNVTPSINLKPFSKESTLELNEHYGAPLDRIQAELLYELLGGHPFLTRLALYRFVSSDAFTFDVLNDSAAQNDGPFSDHLRQQFMLLDSQPELQAAMRQVIFNSTVPNQDAYFRLHGSGLVKMDGDRVVPTNLLYARFFKDKF